METNLFCNKGFFCSAHFDVLPVTFYFNNRIPLRYAMKFWSFLMAVFLTTEFIKNH